MEKADDFFKEHFGITADEYLEPVFAELDEHLHGGARPAKHQAEEKAEKAVEVPPIKQVFGAAAIDFGSDIPPHEAASGLLTGKMSKDDVEKAGYRVLTDPNEPAATGIQCARPTGGEAPDRDRAPRQEALREEVPLRVTCVLEKDGVTYISLAGTDRLWTYKGCHEMEDVGTIVVRAGASGEVVRRGDTVTDSDIKRITSKFTGSPDGDPAGGVYIIYTEGAEGKGAYAARHGDMFAGLLRDLTNPDNAPLHDAIVSRGLPGVTIAVGGRTDDPGKRLDAKRKAVAEMRKRGYTLWNNWPRERLAPTCEAYKAVKYISYMTDGGKWSEPSGTKDAVGDMERIWRDNGERKTIFKLI